MIPSVSPEADWDLSEGATFYAWEANTELGRAFILEYETALALLCRNNFDGRPVETTSVPIKLNRHASIEVA
jgi:hypothetical protein